MLPVQMDSTLAPHRTETLRRLRCQAAPRTLETAAGLLAMRTPTGAAAMERAGAANQALQRGMSQRLMVARQQLRTMPDAVMVAAALMCMTLRMLAMSPLEGLRGSMERRRAVQQEMASAL